MLYNVIVLLNQLLFQRLKYFVAVVLMFDNNFTLKFTPVSHGYKQKKQNDNCSESYLPLSLYQQSFHAYSSFKGGNEEFLILMKLIISYKIVQPLIIRQQYMQLIISRYVYNIARYYYTFHLYVVIGFLTIMYEKLVLV